MSSSEWDRVAASYAVNCTSFCAAHAQDVITSLSRTLSSEEPVTIVEVGCGSGAFALAYLRKYPRGVPGHSIVCIDVSPAMVEQAKKAVTITASDQCHTKFDFYVDDATALQNIPDDYANVVVSMFCVFFVPDQASALKSIRRVLVKDEASVFATSAWTSIPSGLSDAGFGPNLDDMITAALEAFGVSQTGSTAEMIWKKWADESWVKQMLQGEGFKKININKAIHTASLDSADHVVRLATESSPMVDTSKIPPEKLGNARQKLKDALGLSYDSAFMFLTASNIILAHLKLNP